MLVGFGDDENGVVVDFFVIDFLGFCDVDGELFDCFWLCGWYD